MTLQPMVEISLPDFHPGCPVIRQHVFQVIFTPFFSSIKIICELYNILKSTILFFEDKFIGHFMLWLPGRKWGSLKSLFMKNSIKSELKTHNFCFIKLKLFWNKMLKTVYYFYSYSLFQLWNNSEYTYICIRMKLDK